MNSGAFTREELTDFFRSLLENTNRECGKVGYTLEALDVEYKGALSRNGEAPVFLADKDNICIKFNFKPVINIKEG
jgi:hypothetical protein